MFRLSALSRTRALAATLLVAGVVLAGDAITTFCSSDPVAAAPTFTLLTDPAAIAAHQRDFVGTFVTGSHPGDRTIAVDTTGRVRFAEIGARAGYNDGEDTFRLGRIGKNFCLVTNASGIVEATGLDTLVYYGDTYQRR